MTAAAAPAPQGPWQAEPGKRPGLFGARRRLEGLEAERAAAQQRIEMLEAELARHRHDAGRTIHQLQSRVASLQNKDAAALELETRAVGARLHQVREELGRAGEARLRQEVAVRDARDESLRVRRENQTRIEDAQREAAQLIAAARTEAEQAMAAHRVEAERARADSAREVRECQDRLDELERQVVATADLVMLQQAGVYEFRHRLDDAVAYKGQLDHIKEASKTLVRRDAAILSATSWTVNGSSTEGRKMVRDFSKLMLRAYNAEADNCVRTMRPHRLASSIERLERARDSIAKLGATMHIRIDAGYHSVRVQELELTADYLAKQEEEKERIRAERERQRDEDAARKEFEREKTRLAKEKAHWERVQAQWIAAGEDTKVSEAADKLEQLDEAIAGVEAREANTRTGWVYVISNIGAFGEDMVKIGLTRRLDPRERVRELGDASVPFKFDVHALVFSEDAVGLETRMHRELADRRVNRVNLRREFFRATPAEVLAALEKTEARDHLLEFTELAEAPEWRASQTATPAADES